MRSHSLLFCSRHRKSSSVVTPRRFFRSVRNFTLPRSSRFSVDLYRRQAAKRRRFQGRLHFWTPSRRHPLVRAPRYHLSLKIHLTSFSETTRTIVPLKSNTNCNKSPASEKEICIIIPSIYERPAREHWYLDQPRPRDLSKINRAAGLDY